MADFMAQRIIDGSKDYIYVIEKRPDLKEGIDKYLTDKGRSDLIVKVGE